MSEPLVPQVGWGVLHLFCRVGPTVDGSAVMQAAKEATLNAVDVVAFAVLGHKADVGFMLIGPDFVALRKAQADLAKAGLEIGSSYLSLTEVSEYAKGIPAERLEARLHPKLPPEGMRAICFYPMSKRRDGVDNWYTLDYDSRLALMHGHGASGRKFAGRVLQLVTGSTGLDDYEWGVTLFATSPDDLKECVHTMRFDEASARFAVFGPFYAGVVATVDEVLSMCGVVA